MNLHDDREPPADPERVRAVKQATLELVELVVHENSERLERQRGRMDTRGPWGPRLAPCPRAAAPSSHRYFDNCRELPDDDRHGAVLSRGAGRGGRGGAGGQHRV